MARTKYLRRRKGKRLVPCNNVLYIDSMLRRLYDF